MYQRQGQSQNKPLRDAASKKTSFGKTKNSLFERYDLNYLIAGVLKPRHVIFSRRILLWSSTPNAFWRSIIIMPVSIHLSMPIKTKSVSCGRHKSVKKLL